LEASDLLKVAIASDGNYVSAHFGHCPEYTVFDIDGDTVANKTVVPNPGHQPGFLPPYLGRLGVTHIIAGGMGPMAQRLFLDQGIEPILGVSGQIDEVIQSFLGGNLERGESLCNHGEEGHNCAGH
jgi:predicted Fe-Mo cluster-binding NifX family protein